MIRISTPELLPSLLYENPELDGVELHPSLLQEWNELKALKQSLDHEVLTEPSDTSVAIIMAYALGKEEAAPSY
jgi:hypothetical protein